MENPDWEHHKKAMKYIGLLFLIPFLYGIIQTFLASEEGKMILGAIAMFFVNVWEHLGTLAALVLLWCAVRWGEEVLDLLQKIEKNMK